VMITVWNKVMEVATEIYSFRIMLGWLHSY